MPWVPWMMPPVGKSGPGTIPISSLMLMAGFCMIAMVASMVSRRLCGGMFVAMPTAMPVAPLISRLGTLDGSTRGSRMESS